MGSRLANLSSQEDCQKACLKENKICNFLSDSAQELPGGFPESNFRGEIGDFLSDSAQELPGGFPEETILKENFAISCQILKSNSLEAKVATRLA